MPQPANGNKAGAAHAHRAKTIRQGRQVCGGAGKFAAKLAPLFTGRGPHKFGAFVKRASRVVQCIIGAASDEVQIA